MDYDSILKGRRRNWDPLKPDEVREREKEAERQKKREELEKRARKRGSIGVFSVLRQRRREHEQAEDMERFRRALLQGGILIGAFVLALGSWIGLNSWIEAREHARFQEDFARHQQVLQGGEMVNDLSTPSAAFATWQSAWVREDIPAIISTFSPKYFERQTRGGRSRSDLEVEYRRMRQRGLMQSQVDLAASFGTAEPVRAPSRPWSDQELAIFRSEALLRPGAGPDGVRFIVAFSYDERSGQWRFADMREQQYFNVRWERETQIMPARGGARAVRYDEQGNRIEN